MSQIIVFRPRNPIEVIRSRIVQSLLGELDAAQVNRTRLLQLRAERDRLVAETSDPTCHKTARDIHFAEEDLAEWDRAHGAEYERLGGEVDE